MHQITIKRHHYDRYRGPNKTLPLGTYVDEFLAEKRADNLRPPTLSELERFMAQFAKDFSGLNVREFTKDDAETYLTKTYPANRNRKAVLNQFFNFLAQTAQKTNRSEKVLESNPIRLIRRRRQDERDVSDVKILDGKEAVALLKRAAKFNAQRLFLWLLFTGMRPTETVKFWSDPKFGWASINLPKKVILVSPSVSKTRSNRKIRIRPNLAAWLEHYKGQNFLTKNWRDKYGWAKDVLPEEKRGISDICRHTFISYLARVTKGWVEIEQQAGNTKEIQMRHYLDLVHDDPKKFWGITPSTVGVFDLREDEYSRRGNLNRRAAILVNREKIRRKRNGEPINTA